ncbi:MAG: GspB domain-containing protein [Gammaproteobacteria bacterium]|nr:GspB domain-containing protein [Gammaproteobacteria bacterium]
MSFILDALKKSESDRQQQSAPDISSVPTSTVKAATPLWLLVLIGLLAVNLVILTVVLLKPGAAAPAPSVNVPADRFQASPATNRPAQEIQEPVQQEPAASVVLERQPPPERPVKPEVSTVDAAASRTVPARTKTTALLTFNDLRAGGSFDVPDLNIDIHVYSDKPADRFVFINMNQYRENSTLTEGPLVKEITTEGVILEYLGSVFLLPKD